MYVYKKDVGTVLLSPSLSCAATRVPSWQELKVVMLGTEWILVKIGTNGMFMQRWYKPPGSLKANQYIKLTIPYQTEVVLEDFL